MRVLILTQYYPPETGAPQNRLSSLAKHLDNLGAQIEVLTAMPSYPKNEIFPEYRGRKYVKEYLNNILIHRSGIYTSHKKGITHRLTNYFSFTVSSYLCASKKLKQYDVIICESPPLFLGITAVMLKRKWKCKLVFNVSDLWPESAEKMGIIKNKWMIKRSYKLANWIYKNADLISGQTKGITTAIAAMQPKKKLFWFPNGVDVERFHAQQTKKHETIFSLMYAGIIGHAQGLETILYAAQKLAHIPNIHFSLIGDGPVKNNLIELSKSLQLNNITFTPNQPTEKIIDLIKHSNAYIVPLRKLDLFMGAIPSKLFEPLALGIPILLGVDGEAKQLFIDEGNGGLFFEPENADALSEAILQLYNDKELACKLGESGKAYIMKNFRRDYIAASFFEEIKQLH